MRELMEAEAAPADAVEAGDEEETRETSGQSPAESAPEPTIASEGEAPAGEAGASTSKKGKTRAQRRREKRMEEARQRERELEEARANAPDPRQEEVDALNAALRPLRMEVKPVAADGNCLFRAVQNQLQLAEKVRVGRHWFMIESTGSRDSEPVSFWIALCDCSWKTVKTIRRFGEPRPSSWKSTRMTLVRSCRWRRLKRREDRFTVRPGQKPAILGSPCCCSNRYHLAEGFASSIQILSGPTARSLRPPRCGVASRRSGRLRRSSAFQLSSTRSECRR